MTKTGYAKAEARRKAQAQFHKPKGSDDKGLSDYEKARRAVAAKTARLRALRLEKEAADRAAGVKADKAPRTKGVAAPPADEETVDDEPVEETAELDEPGFGADTESEPGSPFADE